MVKALTWPWHPPAISGAGCHRNDAKNPLEIEALHQIIQKKPESQKARNAEMQKFKSIQLLIDYYGHQIHTIRDHSPSQCKPFLAPSGPQKEGAKSGLFHQEPRKEGARSGLSYGLNSGSCFILCSNSNLYCLRILPQDAIAQDFQSYKTTSVQQAVKLATKSTPLKEDPSQKAMGI
ncbi:uncharacterized protein CIMG_12638 [Coccidioides immitis RS]|uniref:Uncharacterized protein n=1 Tax=Coccidioides immitis (strain RS) TaxID=246410 RepID=A0A0D8JS44_COCIM|nr:uncharacterized protein CIMG_12638 [Coccidioides immitis RS]KJF59954.1 hypothetical protein CIMG_12638 [Coccidioides immitis RS]